MREFVAPDFRYRIHKQLSFGDFGVDEYVENLQVWTDQVHAVDLVVGEILGATQDAVVYRHELSAAAADGAETEWSAIIVLVARGLQLSHYEGFDSTDLVGALARFDELNGSRAEDESADVSHSRQRDQE